MRLDKFLADSGFGTRTEIKKLIKSGAVSVLEKNNIKPETKIDEHKDKVFVFGKEIIYKKFIYLLLNKPMGYVSATYDLKLPTVIDLVPEEYLHFEPFPVGRLDIDTEGLLILTNDGALSHRLLSPKSHIPKTYFATIDGVVTEDDADIFSKGVTLDDGYKTKPACLEILKSDKVSEILLTITEGKFHQVKRMFEAVGKNVTFLKRIKMNNLPLPDDLATGDIRELSEEEFMLLCNKI